MSQMTRRSALRVLACGAGVVATACVPGAPSVTTTSTSAPAAAAKPNTARTGGTLRVAIPADITSLDGQISSTSLSTTTGNIFDRLVAYDKMPVTLT